MTHLTKHQRQAKQQQASKVKAFDSGVIQDLLDVALNPDYQPESDVEHHSSDSDTNSLVSNGMSFSLMNSSNIALEDGVGNSNDDKESDAKITCIDVSKQQRTGSHSKFANTVVQFKAVHKTDYYVERCASQAAMVAHKI